MKLYEIFEKLVTDLMKLKSITKVEAEKLARLKAPELAKAADAEKRRPTFDYKAHKAKCDEDKALLIAEKRIKAAEDNLIRQAAADLEKLKTPFTQKVEKRISDLMNDGRQISKTRAIGEVVKNYPFEFERAQAEGWRANK